MPSRNVFDKNKVEIKKNYQSATQGTFDVYYNGEVLAKGMIYSAGTGEYGQAPNGRAIKFICKKPIRRVINIINLWL
jgi:hypothetical protein